MSKNIVRHFYSLFAPTNASSMSFQDVRGTLARTTTATSHLLLSLRLMRVAGPSVPTRRGYSWAATRVAVRETTQEERRIYYNARGGFEGGHANLGFLWLVVFPPSPPAHPEQAHGMILVQLGHITWEQPVQAGQEREAVRALKARMRGEVNYSADFHGLFRTTKPTIEEGNNTNDDVPKPAPSVRSPRKPKGRLKLGHR